MVHVAHGRLGLKDVAARDSVSGDLELGAKRYRRRWEGRMVQRSVTRRMLSTYSGAAIRGVLGIGCLVCVVRSRTLIHNPLGRRGSHRGYCLARAVDGIHCAVVVIVRLRASMVRLIVARQMKRHIEFMQPCIGGQLFTSGVSLGANHGRAV